MPRLPLIATLLAPLAAVLLLAPAAANAAADLPAQVTPAAAEALRYDLHKLIAITEQRGWTIDRYEIDKLLPDALLSVCRTTEAARAATAAGLAARIRALGGPAREAWLRAGKDLDAVDELLQLERMALLLSRARAVASRDCPFYLTASERFSGRHLDADHWFVAAEGGGQFGFRRQDDRWVFGGGGGGRITVGRGLGTRWSLRAGLELGGAALIDERITTDAVYVDWVSAMPVVLRRNMGIYVFDVELAPIAFGIPFRDTIRPGVRVGALFGVSALRIRAVLPWTGLLVTGEYVFGRKGLPDLWTIRAGVVVGFNLSTD